MSTPRSIPALPALCGKQRHVSLGAVLEVLSTLSRTSGCLSRWQRLAMVCCLTSVPQGRPISVHWAVNCNQRLWVVAGKPFFIGHFAIYPERFGTLALICGQIHTERAKLFENESAIVQRRNWEIANTVVEHNYCHCYWTRYTTSCIK